ncbi:hypothetical protein HU200_004977 [Digitaria exilis]|uniref:Potassium transporter n=1 Tax=Digitaria exilis TaxID=1010633 RepID=A0A835FTX4_9POAL|nr:hypothetical protein HU200_004977 [Digitaria exilis]
MISCRFPPPHFPFSTDFIYLFIYLPSPGSSPLRDSRSIARIACPPPPRLACSVLEAGRPAGRLIITLFAHLLLMRFVAAAGRQSQACMDPEFGVGMAPRKGAMADDAAAGVPEPGRGVGDLSISPLDITHSETNEEIFGALSFVFWTLTLIPLIKYVTHRVCNAQTFSHPAVLPHHQTAVLISMRHLRFYSLICRHANVSLLPNRQVADEELSTYKLECPPEVAGRSRVKEWLEKHKRLHTALLVMVMIGTCMVIGDGVLTPAISGFLFAPIVLCWLLCMSAIGLYNIIHWNPHVYQALNPSYMITFLKKTRKSGWMWPVLVLAILASVVGSQAIISGTFSIINQSQVKVVHTSDKIHGQIYIPEVNWMLMILCIAVTVGFRNTKHMGNAAGLAVITVMLVTTCLMSVVIMLCWHRSPLLALAFFLFFGSIEALYFSASLIKFLEGAWVPILLSLILLAVMFVWHYTTIKKYEYDMHNKVTLEWLLALGDKLGMVRVPGIGLVYTDLTSGVPANFSRFVTNLPAFHRSVPVPHVLPAERYLVGRVGPPGHRSYRCIDVDSFETELIESLATFVKLDALFRCSDAGGGGEEQRDSSYYERENALTVIGSNPLRRHLGLGYDDSHDGVSSAHDANAAGDGSANGMELAAAATGAVRKQVRFAVEMPRRSGGVEERMVEELREVCEAREAGTAFILGHSHVQTKPGSSLLKKLAVGVGYNFLRRNCRGPDVVLRVPPASLLEVGMVYVL